MKIIEGYSNNENFIVIRNVRWSDDDRIKMAFEPRTIKLTTSLTRPILTASSTKPNDIGIIFFFFQKLNSLAIYGIGFYIKLQYWKY